MKKILLNTKYSSKKNYKKYFAIVDNEDFAKVSKYKWVADKHGNTHYALTWGNGTGKIKMHHLIVNYKPVDHINHNGLDNRKCNLRPVTNTQNQMNKKPQKNCTSKYKGVHLYKPNGKWQARITLNGVTKSLGYFFTEKEAVIAYNKKAVEFFGEYACLNVI